MERKVKSLFVYPVKSLGAIQLNNSSLTSPGLKYDRNWMLIDNNGKFMTQRKYPSMALFKVELRDNSLLITFQGNSVEVPFEDSGPELDSKVWQKSIHCREVSAEVTDWFSQKFGFTVKLLHFSSLRKVSEDKNHFIPFSDSAPYHLIGDSSLNDLQKKMNADLSPLRFRPNIVVTGFEPYQEDTWKNIKIGNNSFRVFKKNARCKLPGVNPETGIVDQDVLKFLSTYRRDEKNRINFGVHLLLMDGKELNVGDKVEVIPA